MAYLLYLPLLDGDGGQAAVFYNCLLMALGALEVIRAGEDGDAAGIWRYGLRSMICVGLGHSGEITPAVPLEGVGFGLWLIWLTVQWRGGSVRRAVPPALVWAMTALAPTLVVIAFYIFIGHGWEFVQANFLSIFQRHQPADFSSRIFFVPTAEKFLRRSVLLTAYSGGLEIGTAETTKQPARSFLGLWAAFAVVGAFALGNFHDQYAQPLLVLGGDHLGAGLGRCGRRRDGDSGFLGVPAMLSVLGFFGSLGSVRSSPHRCAMVDAARHLGAAHGCIYINDGPTIALSADPLSACRRAMWLPTTWAPPVKSNATNATVKAWRSCWPSGYRRIFIADQPLPRGFRAM